jgi:hypothetical protein
LLELNEGVRGLPNSASSSEIRAAICPVSFCWSRSSASFSASVNR